MPNLHASGVVLGDRGVLVTGPSGAGKSALALALVSSCRWDGTFARLVSDDQVLLEAQAGRLVARAPRSIAGLVEIRGLGPHPVAHEAAMVVDLVVRLVAPAEAPRLDPGDETTLAGTALPLLVLAEREADAAVRAVRARLAQLRRHAARVRRGELPVVRND